MVLRYKRMAVQIGSLIRLHWFGTEVARHVCEVAQQFAKFLVDDGPLPLEDG